MTSSIGAHVECRPAPAPIASPTSSSSTPSPIAAPYLLIAHTPCYVDDSGERYLDELWAKDLAEHLEYIDQLTLVCPIVNATPPPGHVALSTVGRCSTIELVHLPVFPRFRWAFGGNPIALRRLWKAIGRSSIVHSTVSDRVTWPVSVLVRFRNRFHLIVVEAAPWRLSADSTAGRLRIGRAMLTERLNRWCVNRADLAVFTHAGYRDSLLTRPATRGHVIPASWIDEDVILSDDVADSAWQERLGRTPSEGLRVLYCGRLTVNKGLPVLLEAMNRLSDDQVSVSLDILGRGDLLDECKQASSALRPPAAIRMLEPVPYASLFALLRTYDAVVVPSISDEQPRIVFDAYSQGIPVVASGTTGLRECVWPGVTGVLTHPGDARALADALARLLADRPGCAAMGMRSLHAARELTHREMHRRRWQILSEAIADGARSTAVSAVLPLPPPRGGSGKGR